MLSESVYPVGTSCQLLPELHSTLLDRQPLRYVFTYKPVAVGGSQLSEEDKWENRRHWARAAGMLVDDTTRFCVPQQVHGVRIAFSNEPPPYEETDALVLESPGPIALVQVADCVPLLVYAPDVHKAAVVHAGWRGTSQRIAPQVVETLCQRYQTTPDRLQVLIGPAIGLAGYEVDQAMVDTLRTTVDQPEAADGWLAKHPATGHWHVDLKTLNATQLLQAGVEQVEMLLPTTDRYGQWLWSYRRGDWQRQGLMVQLL